MACTGVNRRGGSSSAALAGFCHSRSVRLGSCAKVLFSKGPVFSKPLYFGASARNRFFIMPRPLLPTISSGRFEFLSEERSASESNPMLKEAEGVRSLPPQSASLDVRETNPDSGRKARHWQAFAIGGKVSELLNPRNARPIRQKSPAITANIPVFGETASRDRV